jgi:CRISPR-associated protein Cas5h
LLGILGAILGLEGYQKRGVLPEYYQQLKNLKVGIAPLGDDRGNFQKTTIVYTNTVGYANKDGNLIAYENTLVRPSYRVFIILQDDHPLYDYLKKSKAEYIPYLGKNEFPVWWKPDSFREYDHWRFSYEREYQVKTLFRKKEEESSRGQEAVEKSLGFAALFTQFSESFFYFERLPIGFQEFQVKKRGREYQYEMAPFVYSDAKFSMDYHLDNLYELDNNEVVQLN